MGILLSAVAAIAIGSLIEWLVHKFILHNFNIKQLSRCHFGIHHRKARQNEGYDENYIVFPPRSWDKGQYEIVSLIIGVTIASPIALIAPWVWIFLGVHAMAYYYLHRKMHLNPTWGKRWFPWHWTHHMGKDQNSNWGVTNPIFDYVFGTAKK